MDGEKKSMVIEKGSNKVLRKNNNEKTLGLESELFSFCLKDNLCEEKEIIVSVAYN